MVQYLLVTLQWHQPHSEGELPVKTMEVDACLSGYECICVSQYYRGQCPPHILQAGHHISCLELLNIIVAIKVWHSLFQSKDNLIHCDNEASVSVLQTWRSSDMLQCAQEIWYFAAIHDFAVHAKHKQGVQMTLPDALSRAHLLQHCNDRCAVLLTQHHQEVSLNNNLFRIQNDI